MHVICKQKLSVLETKQRWNARREIDELQFPSLKVSCTVKLSSSIIKWLWLEFSSDVLLGTGKLLLNNARFLQWLSLVRFENARLYLDSAWNEKRELILDGVV